MNQFSISVSVNTPTEVAVTSTGSAGSTGSTNVEQMYILERKYVAYNLKGNVGRQANLPVFSAAVPFLFTCILC